MCNEILNKQSYYMKRQIISLKTKYLLFSLIYLQNLKRTLKLSGLEVMC